MWMYPSVDKAPRLSISIVIWILSSDTVYQLNQLHKCIQWGSNAVLPGGPSPPEKPRQLRSPYDQSCKSGRTRRAAAWASYHITIQNLRSRQCNFSLVEDPLNELLNSSLPLLHNFCCNYSKSPNQPRQHPQLGRKDKDSNTETQKMG